MATKPERFVEVYEADTAEEARRVADVVLKAEGIEAVLHDRVDHALLAPASQPGGFHVAVRENDAVRAIRILTEAEHDGYIGEAGKTAPLTDEEQP